MQSAHASACFVRIGRCCLGSIFGSILGHYTLFWSPWEPTGPPNRYLFFSYDFEGPGRIAQGGEQGGGGGGFESIWEDLGGS